MTQNPSTTPTTSTSTSTNPTSNTTGNVTGDAAGEAAGDVTIEHPAATQRALDTALAHARAATTAMLTDLDGPGVWEAATLHTITVDLLTLGATPTHTTDTSTSPGTGTGVDADAGAAVRAARDALATIPDDQRTARLSLAFGELNRISTLYPTHDHTSTSDTGGTITGAPADAREVRA